MKSNKMHHFHLALLHRLLAACGQAVPRKINPANVRFTYLQDGGMGSVRVAEEGIEDNGRRFGAKVSELIFVDQDGVRVSVSLHVDQFGNPLEIDVFKADFSPVVKLQELC